MIQKSILFPLVVISLFSCNRENKSIQTDKPFLDSLSHRTFNFFWEQADSVTGNQPDRWPTESFSSIAATGFGLTSYLVGVNRNYLTRDKAARRVLKTIRFFSHAPQGLSTSGVTGYKGFFYHFIDMRTG